MDRSKNFVIGALLCAIIIMSVGYALISSTLTINATGKIDADWNIHFVKDSVTTSFVNASNAKDSEQTEIAPTADGLTASFTALLEKPGSSASYTFTVQNEGTIDAELTSLTGVTDVNTTEPTALKFEVTGMTAKDGSTAGTVVKAGQTATITVKVTWDTEATEIPETKTKTATIKLGFEQA